MIASSANTAPRYIQLKPDWGEDYDFVAEFLTGISRAENGAEQRSRRRDKAKYSIAYRVSGITRAEIGLVRVEAMRGIGAPLAVPIWHAWESFLSLVAETLTLATAQLLLRPFKPGRLIYIEETGKASVFVRVVSLGASTILIEAGNAEYPDIMIPAFTTAAKVYPVIEGMADENTTQFQSLDLNNWAQAFDVKEL